jgi:hypothetical protein
MKPDEEKDLHCNYERSSERHPAKNPLFRSKKISGQPMAPQFVEKLFPVSSGERVEILVVVHVVGVHTEIAGQFKPVVPQDFIDTMFRIANGIWGQACVELFQFRPGMIVTTFMDLNGTILSCLDSESAKLVKPYDVTYPGWKVVNLYIVRSSGGFACGDPNTGHVVIQTISGYSAEALGRVLAHEIGHILLNPIGVDDSADPDHLMFHEGQHPNIPPGSRDSLSMSDCLGGRLILKEDIFHWTEPGGKECILNPRLGNDVSIVWTDPVVKD